jgi:hypothetical protein
VLHGDRKPPSVFLVTAFVPGRRICIIGECLRGYGGITLFRHPAKRTTWRTEPVAELRPCRGAALLGGYIAGTGLPVFVWRNPIPLSLDAQGLTLSGRGYLGLSRCLVGFGRVVEFDGWLIYVPGEDVRGTIVRPEAIFASSSAVSLYRRATWLSSSPWNLSSKR